ncbi:uncharacterized protein LTHEOB_594 [Lasiodiplodia theobromae]|uniref:uncharacterized protein n=1 Tax=Lasiodiplodia theobromae TaxID=45133 RepID=UPI0015C2EC20|nr:uncharacterized protein LTHEOB_594 [Lasiodiplodia theobromae]KAF4540652.1 hypothetical protein LTHEOB_594 [Lasiodiplodia theobromae]
MSKMQLLRKVDEWKAIESERDKFIEELCEDNDRLLAEVNRLKLEAERANFEAKDHFDRFKKSEDLINRLQQKHDDGAYVSVLVDGDCVLFKDEHIRRGVTGGTESAARISVHIRIYANVKGLGQAYYNAGILFDPSDIWSFMRGFNMGHPMCDFIDAGDGKECSDDKLKETFRSNISNVHCKHILLACSADNGYARLLAPLKADKDAVQLVTLVEGPPFATNSRPVHEALRMAARPDTQLLLRQAFRSKPAPFKTAKFRLRYGSQLPEMRRVKGSTVIWSTPNT